jgi:hypothetical protein
MATAEAILDEGDDLHDRHSRAARRMPRQALAPSEM